MHSVVRCSAESRPLLPRQSEARPTWSSLRFVKRRTLLENFARLFNDRVILRYLQREQFGDPKIWDQVSKIPMSSRVAREQILSSLDLISIDLDLIKDAQSEFENGSFPDRHVAASNSRRKKNGKTKPVYEVRSKVGAAWRGGIVIDDFGDPWLVYAAPHDKFHDTAPSFFADETKYLPVRSDYKLRNKEELTRIIQEQDIQYLRQLLEILTKALMDSPAEHFTQLHGQANDVVQVLLRALPISSPPSAQLPPG